MKIRLLTCVLACCFAFCGAALAQAPKKGGDKKAPAPKTPADLAFDAFQKLRNAGASKQQAGFQNLINAGVKYLMEFPTHSHANRVVGELGYFANTHVDPKNPALRVSYVSLLKLEVMNQKYKEGVTDPVKAALAAVEATAADSEVRLNPTPDSLATLREKIDALVEAPGGTRFLRDRERSYAQLLTLIKQTPRAEAQLQKLAKHSDKGIADMAREELNVIEVKKTPYALKFTALDGKEVDFAKLRGKAVALYFWSSTNKGSADALEPMKQIHSKYRKNGFEVVTVSYDKAEDREKLTKFIKDRRVAFPVYYDGKQAKNGFSPKLNVYSVPRLLLFDKAGILQSTMQGTNLSTNLSVRDLEGQVKRLLEIKTK